MLRSTSDQFYHVVSVLILVSLFRLTKQTCNYSIETSFLRNVLDYGRRYYNGTEGNLVLPLPPAKCTKLETAQERDVAFSYSWNSRTVAGNSPSSSYSDIFNILGPTFHAGARVIEVTGSAGSELDTDFTAGYIYLTPGGDQHGVDLLAWIHATLACTCWVASITSTCLHACMGIDRACAWMACSCLMCLACAQTGMSGPPTT